MAVPFHVPDANASAPATSAATSTNSSTTTTTTTTIPQPQNPNSGSANTAIYHEHTMPMSPINNEYLVQAFCEALYRYSRAGGSLTTPPSPSSCTNAYGNSEVFFNFNDPETRLDDFYGSPRRYRSHSLSIPLTTRHIHQMTDDEDDDSSEENFSESNNNNNNNMDENYNYMTLREQLQEFPGRVPQQRKRKSTATDLGNPRQQQQQSKQKHKNKPKEQKFAWSTLVALGVLAVGCGLLATR